MNSPVISVIMPAFNAESTLPEAIESVLSQTFSSFELLVIDDGSSDGTCNMARCYAQSDDRVRVLVNEVNVGISKSRNLALKAARGEFIACLDSDDVAEPSRLALQVAFLTEHPEVVLVGSDLVIINEQSQIVGFRTYPHNDASLRRALPRRNPFAQPASMFRAAVVQQLGGYREDLAVCEDYDLFFRMAEKGEVANLDQPLTRYRVSTTQSKTTRLRETVRHTLQVQALAFARGWQPRLGDRIYRSLLRGLLWVPQPLVLGAFKLLTYRSGKVVSHG